MNKRDWLRIDGALALAAVGTLGGLAASGTGAAEAAALRLVADLDGVGRFDDSSGTADFEDDGKGNRDLEIHLTNVEVVTPIIGAGANLDVFVGPFLASKVFFYTGTMVLRNRLTARFEASTDEGDVIKKIRAGTVIEIRRGSGPTPSPVIPVGTVILRGKFVEA